MNGGLLRPYVTSPKEMKSVEVEREPAGRRHTRSLGVVMTTTTGLLLAFALVASAALAQQQVIIAALFVDCII